MKNLILSVLTLLLTTLAFSQDKLITRTGKITFSSETPVEKIYAENNQAASIFLISKKIVAFNVLLKSFKFEKALMEEHFNEKYVHSDTHPAAKFKGTLNVDIDLNVPKVYENVEIAGQMDFHGESKPLTVKANIEVNKDKTIKLISNFDLNLEAFKIEIPSLIKEKIASDIAVNIVANYK